MELEQAIQTIESLDIGEAKKIRLRSVIRKRYALSTKHDMELDIKRLSKLSRNDLNKIGRVLKSAKTATNHSITIQREFKIEV